MTFLLPVSLFSSSFDLCPQHHIKQLWRQEAFVSCRYISTRLHGVTSLKVVICISTAMITSTPCFLFTRLTLGSNQPSTQWKTRDSFPGDTVTWWLKPIAHIHLYPSIWMREVTPPLHHTSPYYIVLKLIINWDNFIFYCTTIHPQNVINSVCYILNSNFKSN